MEQLETTTTEYLSFTRNQRPGAKTYMIDVQTKDKSTYLGVIKWWSHWRRYVFTPSKDTLFDAACLTDITSYINKLMLDRKTS